MDRVWVHIRQDKPKKWRTATTLSYVNGVDILFRIEDWPYRSELRMKRMLKRMQK
jgi:hypothetical protein